MLPLYSFMSKEYCLKWGAIHIFHIVPFVKKDEFLKFHTALRSWIKEIKIKETTTTTKNLWSWELRELWHVSNWLNLVTFKYLISAQNKMMLYLKIIIIISNVFLYGRKSICEMETGWEVGINIFATPKALNHCENIRELHFIQNNLFSWCRCCHLHRRLQIYLRYNLSITESQEENPEKLRKESRYFQ